MKCIYCLKDGTRAKGRAHVVPESLVRNDVLLPLGAVCDPCNNYLGKLDATLASHPTVSLGIQALKLPGKSGRVRKAVGNVGRGEVPDAITIPIEPPQYRYEPKDRSFTVTPMIHKGFDELRFRRSLHHIALNVIAWEEGPLAALESEFTPVRKYVRAPNRGEAWPFGYLSLLPHAYRNIDISVKSEGEALVVAMRLFSAVFIIDLLNSADFVAVIEEQKQRYPELRYVSKDQALPTHEPRTDRKQYRITIYDED